MVLVDNAEQPMQAAPAAAMRALARTGSAGKLHAVFTHFDAVTGDNLPTERDKALHVLNSCNGVLNAVGNELGPFAERPLRRQVQNASYFVGNAHRVLDPDVDVTAVTHLRRLLTDLERDIAAPTLADTRPVYDLTTLIVAIRDAVDDFQTHWKYVLGQATSMDVQKEHWKRIQALARRFAHREADEYLHLRPVAHLQAELQGEIFKLIQNPDAWSTAQPSEEDQQALYDDFANRLSRRLLDLSHRRVSDERHHEWQEAFLQSGKGSAAIRARIIADDVYAKAAPVPRAIPAPHAHQFLDEVMSIVRETAAELDIALR